MKRSSYYPGPVGTCSSCGKGTLVRLGSLVKPVTAGAWVVQQEVVTTLYLATAKTAIGQGEIFVKDYFHELGKDGCYHPKPIFETVRKGRISRCPRCGRSAKTLLWVDLSGAPGATAEAIEGPFCGVCFKNYKRKFESSEGVGADLPVYYLGLTPERLAMIEEAIRDGWGAIEVLEPLPSDPTNNLF